MIKSIARIIVFAAIFAALVPTANAEFPRAEFEIYFESNETRRRAIVLQKIKLDAAEADKFWPLYDSYRNDVKLLQLDLFDNLALYAEKFAALDDDTATELLSNGVEIENKLHKLKAVHIKKAKRILTPLTALRYFQLDLNLHVAERVSLQRQLPLAGADLEALTKYQDPKRSAN
ncbi:MAG: hypothetical protein ACFBZ9_06460 [Sphingomonadales bacterium]